jgi:Cytochrome c3
MRLGAILMFLGMLVPLAAAPKRQLGVAPTQCAACHGTQKVLPAGHVPIGKAKPGACAECHKAEASLRGKLNLAHRHALAGVTCADCHGKGKPAARPKPSVCAACHDLEALIEKTAQAKDQNPHKDQHGYSVNCNLCHHAHKPATNHCLTCHDFKWPVP